MSKKIEVPTVNNVSFDNDHSLLFAPTVIHVLSICTVKTGVSFRHLLRHRNSASASVISTFQSVCLRLETTFLSVKMKILSVKTKLRVLEMTLLSV
jgi:hypothetical protein